MYFVATLVSKTLLALIRSILILVLTSNAVLPEHNLTEIAIVFPRHAREYISMRTNFSGNIMRVRKVLYLFFSLLILVSLSHGATDILLNGSAIPLVTGDSYGLYQGYVLTLKSVSGDSVWLQLTDNDRIVKSEVVAINGYFIYNKTNMTILSAKIDNIYSGSSEQSLVSLYPVYQFTDPDKPPPNITEEIPDNQNLSRHDNSSIRISTPEEPVIWAFGIVFILILFYIARKYW